MKVGIYARVSTDVQTTENQLPKLREYATNRGWEIYKEYIDDDIRESDRNFSQFDRMIVDAQIQEFKILLVTKVTRLTTSISRLSNTVQELNKSGIVIVSLDGMVDTTTTQGKTFFTMTPLFAKIERDMSNQRTKLALARKKARGEVLGRPQTVDTGVEKAVGLRNQGKGWRTVARELNVNYQTLRYRLRKVLKKGYSVLQKENQEIFGL